MRSLMASRTYRAEAIVLRTVDFAEADRILALFTRHFGKVRVVAKGIRRATSRMAGHAEPLTHATYQLARGRELDVLTGAEARAIYRDMRDDLALIAAGWYVAELVDRFTADRVPSAPLFDLLETSLRALDAGINAPTVCRWFDLHLLDRSGFRPELGECAQCRKALAEETNAWEPAAGGAICTGCAARLPYVAPLTVRGLKSLRYLLVSDLAAASRLRLDALLTSELDRKRRGFVFPSSEIYGGAGATWDFGPLGVELKNNVKRSWWRAMVQLRDDVVGLDGAILMHPRVWEASGHVENFTDPLVECRNCRKRFRLDDLPKGDELATAWRANKLDLSNEPCPNCGSKPALSQPRRFNLMFKTFVGPLEDTASIAWLRPETAQSIFVDFESVQQATRRRLPFGIAQIGKAFRNEITPGNFIFRS